LIQGQPKFFTYEWIRFCDRTDGYGFRADAMIFPHKNRLFPLNFADPLINKSSHCYYVCPAPQMHSDLKSRYIDC